MHAGGQCIGFPLSPELFWHAPQLPASRMPDMVVPVSDGMVIPMLGIMVIWDNMALARAAGMLKPTVTNTASSNAMTCLGDIRAFMILRLISKCDFGKPKQKTATFEQSRSPKRDRSG